MARSFNGSSDFMSAAVNLSSFNQITISFWLWWTTFANNDALAGEYSANYNSNNGTFLIDPNDSTSTKFAFAWNPTGGKLNATFTRPSSGAWHNYVFLIDGTQTNNAAIPSIYVDGTSQSLSYGGSAATASLGNFTLYFMSRGGASLFGTGKMADYAIWGGALLTAGEASALSKGARPKDVRPGSLSLYLPIDGLQSPEPDLSGLKQNGSLTGTALTLGAPTMMFSPRTPIIQTAVAAAGQTFQPAWAMRNRIIVEGIGI